MRHLTAALTTVLFLVAANGSAKEKYAPLPPQIMEAKTVYLDNQTANAHAGDELFQDLTNWKRFRIVSDKKDADLIFALQAESHQAVTSAPTVTNQVGATKITTGGVRSYETGSSTLTIQDAQDGSTVWANTKPYSRKGATHDLIEDLRKRIEAQEKPQK